MNTFPLPFFFTDSGGDVDIAVTSTKEVIGSNMNHYKQEYLTDKLSLLFEQVKVSAVREAFQTVFGKATVK